MAELAQLSDIRRALAAAERGCAALNRAWGLDWGGRHMKPDLATAEHELELSLTRVRQAREMNHG